MSKDKEPSVTFSNTVLSDGRPIAVSRNPYADHFGEGFNIDEARFNDDLDEMQQRKKLQQKARRSSGTPLDFENKKLRLECIKLSIAACAHHPDDDQLVIDTMKRFWRFVRNGD